MRSNVRAFREEKFDYWRCGKCGSIHAQDEVDLGHYYARYPFHALAMDWRLKAMYSRQVGRLVAAGVQKSHRILDYGCGGGQLVRYLQSLGFQHVHGYDEYSKEFGDKAVLDERYDCIVSQDVIEHVAEPHGLLSQLPGLTRPGAVVAVGTPSAAPRSGAAGGFRSHDPRAVSPAHPVEASARRSRRAPRLLARALLFDDVLEHRVPFLNEAFSSITRASPTARSTR